MELAKKEKTKLTNTCLHGVWIELDKELPGVGLVEIKVGCVSSCKIELIKVVGESGVSTGVAPYTSTSGLDGSSLMLDDWFSLKV